VRGKKRQLTYFYIVMVMIFIMSLALVFLG